MLDHFIQHFCTKRNRKPFVFTPEAVKCLLRYEWRGNVRELENLIERLSILVNSDTISVNDLPERFHSFASVSERFHYDDNFSLNFNLTEGGCDLNKIIFEIEKSLILNALTKTGWVKSRAATLLGLNRTTLIEKMKKMGIEKT